MEAMPAQITSDLCIGNWGQFLDALASLETTQVGQSVSQPQFRKSHRASV